MSLTVSFEATLPMLPTGWPLADSLFSNSIEDIKRSAIVEVDGPSHFFLTDHDDTLGSSQTAVGRVLETGKTMLRNIAYLESGYGLVSLTCGQDIEESVVDKVLDACFGHRSTGIDGTTTSNARKEESDHRRPE